MTTKSLAPRYWFTARIGTHAVTSEDFVDAAVGLAWLMDLPKDVHREVWAKKKP